MSEENGAYFTRSFSRSFGEYLLPDEDMHSEIAGGVKGYALTETQYFSFSIPDQNIQAYLYLWWHPKLGVVSGGPVVFQGVKPIPLAAELFDYQNYLPDEQLRGSLTNYTLGNSYSVELVEAPSTYRIRYSDPARGNQFDVLLKPLSAPRVWPGNHHFDQIVWAQGDLTLRGQSCEVDGPGFRNRSWGEQRTEEPFGLPPFSRLTGLINDRLSFTVACFDDPGRAPIWRDGFTLSEDKVLKFGWVDAEGKLSPITKASTRTFYDECHLLPTKVDLRITDARGRFFELSGDVTAALPISTWLNIRTVGGQMRWTCDGIEGWGEFINAQGGDFLHRHSLRVT